jgi:Winged helix-turn-helix DNA-binding
VLISLYGPKTLPYLVAIDLPERQICATVGESINPGYNAFQNIENLRVDQDTLRNSCNSSRMIVGSHGTPEDKAARMASGPHWTFPSNHGTVLLCIAQEPEIRLHQVAERVGITEWAVQRIVADLEEAGYLSTTREARRNRYEIHTDRPFRHPVVAHRDVSLLLGLIDGFGVPGKTEAASWEAAQVMVS